MSQKRSARKVKIELGDLLDPLPVNLVGIDTLPDDLNEATQVMLAHVQAAYRLKDDDARSFAHQIFNSAWKALSNEALMQSRDPGGGPKGPRLPAGYAFADLLPHLSEGRRILATKPANRKVRFEDWLASHDWPGGMKVKETTARTWITRYAKHIAAYDDQTNPRKARSRS
jgi:hypothetical protein